MRKRSLLIGDSISKLTLIRKAVKAECEGCEMRKRSLVRTVRVRRMC